MVPDAVCGGERRTRPLGAGQQANGQVGAVAAEVDGLEPALAEPLADLGQPIEAGLPGGHRVVLVKPAHARDLLRQPLERLVDGQVGMHSRRPLRRRAGDDAPVDQALHHQPQIGLPHRRLIGSQADRVESVGGGRVERRLQGDHGHPLLSHLLHALNVPGRRVSDRLVAGVLDLGPAHERVGVGDVDVPGAGPIGGCRHGPRQRFAPELGGHHHDLIGLYVGSEANGELGQPLGQQVVHGPHCTQARMAANATARRTVGSDTRPPARGLVVDEHRAGAARCEPERGVGARVVSAESLARAGLAKRHLPFPRRAHVRLRHGCTALPQAAGDARQRRRQGHAAAAVAGGRRAPGRHPGHDRASAARRPGARAAPPRSCPGPRLPRHR